MAVEPLRISTDLVVAGALRVDGTKATLPNNCITNSQVDTNADIVRSKLVQETLVEYAVPWTWMFVHDAPATTLPAAGANDDLGLYGAAFGTNTPYVATGELQALSAQRYGRFVFPLPAEYDNNQSITIRVKARVNAPNLPTTTKTLGVRAYLSDDQIGVTGSELTSSAVAQTLTLSWANYDFTLDTAGTETGANIDVRFDMNINDSGGAVEVTIGEIGKISMLMDVKG